MKPSRLSGRKVNQLVLRKGTMWKGNTMTARILKGPPKSPNVNPEDIALYIGTYAPIKLHKSAVKRNKMRRRCREALRTHIKNIEKIPTVQLLICPRSSSLDCDFSLIQKDIEKLVSFVSQLA